jgi:hypothetical protein
MSAALFVPILAALQSAPASPSPAATPVPLELEIRDIAPPMDVFPYPPWMVATALAVAALLLALIVWLIVSWVRRRPAPPPPSATAVALRELEKLRTKVSEIEPYGFSVAVSDVLRTFIGDAKFKLPATRQTSPELLAVIARSAQFTEGDRSLLGRFLEKCDMIKFARMDATREDNAELVESALAFVQGGRA